MVEEFLTHGNDRETMSGSTRKARDFCDTWSRTCSVPSAADFVGSDRTSVQSKTLAKLSVVSWNTAAPNKNPFEYWSMHEIKEYDELMLAVQKCIDEPSKLDTSLVEIFTDSMYRDLRRELEAQHVADLDLVDKEWTSNIRTRKCISEFLRDLSFGEKRLISMPDRMTNSVKTAQGQVAHRPSPITGFVGEMPDVASWWPLWKEFMFRTPICVRGTSFACVNQVIETIPRSKYPALTDAEERMSRPLQVLCLALFDAVYTHLLSVIAPSTWQALKRELREDLFENKASNCINLLRDQYVDADIIFVQEASEAFAARAGVCLNHVVLRPTGVDGRRSQMSLILVNKETFSGLEYRDLTDEVLGQLKTRCVEAGDLCVFKVNFRSTKFVLASFHGDSNGRSTGPVLAALDRLAKERYPDHVLIFGLDANPPSDPSGLDGPDGRWEMEGLLAGAGMSSCWAGQDLRDVWTTFSARTYLQPQLHKAVPLSRVMDPAHRRLKDWILFYGAQVAVQDPTTLDNTGHGKFEARVMPSRGFPSDHALVSASLVLAESAEL
mmetsp:Transcript_73693/g.196058  ORF Transcript_73693/g.196058 Transcript_73693/m.196058 type:complete len:552 (-) Transcript_73693:622-2277(-)